jgi:putative Ca2+/H+ antiporter (TMEM165/GDT1 family)
MTVNLQSIIVDEGFLRSASMILASEIGDKTFFIAAIMAMSQSRLTVRVRFCQFELLLLFGFRARR